MNAPRFGTLSCADKIPARKQGEGMKKICIFVLIAAVASPVSNAFAGASNPMSQSYNAVSKGKNETGRMDARKATRPAKPPMAKTQQH
jgi:hypothetical protein